MEFIYLALSFIQSLAVSLGVGSSTFAVLNYIVASKDGDIDQSERRLMGIVYKILRLSMITILLTMLAQALLIFISTGSYTMHTFVLSVWVIVIVLFVNAVLMTYHMVPKFLGPALQAGSWYSLAVLYFCSTIGFVNFTFTQFVTGYLVMIVLGTLLINGTLAYSKTRV